MRCVISQTWDACLPYRGFDAMRLPDRLKITDAERDERIKKTVEARISPGQEVMITINIPD